MTGMEAWSIVSPLLAAHSVRIGTEDDGGINLIDKAYAVVYRALRTYDEGFFESKGDVHCYECEYSETPTVEFPCRVCAHSHVSHFHKVASELDCEESGPFCYVPPP